MLKIELTIPLFAIHHHKIGGTESAIYNLIHGLAQTDASLTLAFSDIARLSPEFQAWMSHSSNIRLLPMPRLPGPKNSRFAEEMLFEWRRQGHGWAIYPNYFLPPRRFFHRTRSAVILHDIQYKLLPQYHSTKRKIWLDFYLPRMFESADIVFLISESERTYVERFFGPRAAAKCRVIYNAIEWSRFDSGPLDEAVTALTQRPYILTVSHPFPHKNLATLIQAFDRVARVMPDICLYLAGKDSPEKHRMISHNATAASASRIIMTGIVSDAELGEFYRQARLFVLPSLYEGFGMPAAEAMGMGVPTLVSGVTSLPEVTLGQAHYVDDPLDVKLWADKMIGILRSGERPSPELTGKIRDTFNPARVANSLLSNLS